MSGPIGAPMSVGAIDGTADIVARLTALDARIRVIDPNWQGLSAAGVSAGNSTLQDAGLPGNSAFANVLSSETTRASSAALDVQAAGIPASVVPVELRLVRPVVGATTSQDFGPTTLGLEPPAVVDGVRYAHFHAGLDLAAPLGTTVRAAAAGVVLAAGRQADGAVVVRIRHDDGSETIYGHLQPDTAVHKGDRVDAGQAIGAIGLTGMTTGPHLHFELVVKGKPVDPAPWIASGRLPGAATTASVDSSVADPGLATGLAAFDAVAEQIPYAAQIRAAAVAAKVDPLLLASLVRAESGFRADAVSSAGALGLAQLMPFNVRSLGVTDPFDPAQNVTAAARYLANNLRLYGRTDVALAAYQAGKGSVARAGGIPDSPTTRHYIDRILGFWSGYLENARQAGVGEAAA
jgi:murein DD-endopeptidase MepM/ murein hydrolase activator NlpD